MIKFLLFLGRVIIPSRKNQSEKKSDDASTQQDEKSVGDENSVISLGEVVESIANAKHLIESSQKKWGKGFTAESACWDVVSYCVTTYMIQL